MSKQRKYSLEFKEQILKEMQDGELGQDAIGKKYGISISVLLRWRKKYEHGGLSELAADRRGKTKSMLRGRKPKNISSELEKLRYKNVKLQMEVLRLKKLDEYLRGNAISKRIQKPK